MQPAGSQHPVYQTACLLTADDCNKLVLVTAGNGKSKWFCLQGTSTLYVKQHALLKIESAGR